MPAYRPTPWMRCTAKSPGSSSSAIESVRRRVKRGADPRVPARAEQVLLGRQGQLARLRTRTRWPAATPPVVGTASPDHLARALQRAVAAGRDDERYPRAVEVARARAPAPRRCPGPSPSDVMPRSSPSANSVRRNLHTLRRARPRAGGAPAAPGHSIASASASAFRVRLARAVERSMRVGQHHPRALGQELGRRGHLVEQERARATPRLPRTARRPGAASGSANRSGVPLRSRRAHGRAGPRRGSARATGGTSTEATASGGQLGRGHELAERLDLVAPELQAHRPARRAREHVDHAATHRELASVLDHVGARVAEVDEPLARARRAADSRPATSCSGTVRPASGSAPASPRAPAPPARTRPWLRAGVATARHAAPTPRATARSARTAGTPTQAATRRDRRPGTPRRRRRAPRPRGGRPPPRTWARRARSRRAAITKGWPASARATIGRARSSSSRSNGSDPEQSRVSRPTRPPDSDRTPRTGLAAAGGALGEAV